MFGLGARVGEDWGFEGRDGTEGPGAATAVAEPIWERGECVLWERANLRSFRMGWGLSQAVGRRGVRKDLGGKVGSGDGGWSKTRSPGTLGEHARFSLELVLSSAPSPLRVEGSRPVAKRVVREQWLTFLPTVVIDGNKPPSLHMCRDKI